MSQYQFHLINNQNKNNNMTSHLETTREVVEGTVEDQGEGMVVAQEEAMVVAQEEVMEAVEGVVASIVVLEAATMIRIEGEVVMKDPGEEVVIVIEEEIEANERIEVAETAESEATVEKEVIGVNVKIEPVVVSPTETARDVESQKNERGEGDAVVIEAKEKSIIKVTDLKGIDLQAHPLNNNKRKRRRKRVRRRVQQLRNPNRMHLDHQRGHIF